jgi:hypothetical protein
MADRKISLSIKEHPDLFLGVTQGPGPQGYNYTLSALRTDGAGTNWILRDIPGTSAQLLVKDGGVVSGKVVTFGAKGDYLTLRPYQEGNIEQFVIFMPLDGSYVAINNHDETHVMDRSMRAEDKGWVIAFPWNGGDNQRWGVAYYS